MLVTIEDLKTEMYTEVLSAISRGDRDELEKQLKAAEDFAKAYLFKFDLKALFGDAQTPPIIHDEMLTKAIKVIASYFIVRKANPSGSIELFREDWLLMVGTEKEPGWLTDIKKGVIVPDWPLKPDNPQTVEDESQKANGVFWNSEKKRTNRF